MYAGPRLLLVATIAVTSTTAGFAQHPLILQRLTAWNAAAPQPAPAKVQEQVMKAAIAAQKSSGGCVPTGVVIDSATPATSVRFVFQGILAGNLKNAGP